MIIVARYSHKEGLEFIREHHPAELSEIEEVIKAVDAEKCKVKISREKTMAGRLLYSPKALNEEFMRLFRQRGWRPAKIAVETYVPEIGYRHRGFREMDLVKNKVGVEVQFGKYAFMCYNVLAKMTIFANKGIIECGVEIVPMHAMAKEMSTGVGYFEQFKTDLELRGIANIDIPVLVLGVDVGRRPHQERLL